MFTQVGALLQNSIAPSTASHFNIMALPVHGVPETINTATVGTFTFTFTPVAGQCATTATMIIEVTNKGTVSDVEGNAI